MRIICFPLWFFLWIDYPVEVYDKEDKFDYLFISHQYIDNYPNFYGQAKREAKERAKKGTLQVQAVRKEIQKEKSGKGN